MIRSLFYGTSSVRVFEMDTCSLRKWLEFQFSDGMSLDNYGKLWEFDHCIPLKNFDLTNATAYELANNWRNIRPSFIRDNTKKGGKFLMSLILEQRDRVNRYNQDHNSNDNYWRNAL
jgi:hypothetical protein